MAIDADGGVLWLGFFRGVRVVGGGGDFGRSVVFLALWGAPAACRMAIWGAVSLRTVFGLI